MKDSRNSLPEKPRPEKRNEVHDERPVYLCDRCGFEMVERQCKVICPNCGSRWDCSDLSIYVDEQNRGQTTGE